MIEDKNNLTVKNFFSHYIFDPQSRELSATDQKIAILSTCILGVCTLGILHFFVFAYSFFADKIKTNPSSDSTTTNTKAVFRDRIPKVPAPAPAFNVSSNINVSSVKIDKNDQLFHIFNEIVESEIRFAEKFSIIATDGLQLFSDLQKAGAINTVENAMLAEGWERLSGSSAAFCQILEQLDSPNTRQNLTSGQKLTKGVLTAFSPDNIVRHLATISRVIIFQKKMITILENAENDKNGKRILNAYRKDHKNESIHSHIIMPVQRPPRYIMLFKQALKNIPKKFPVKLKNSLEKSLEEIQKIVNEINSAVHNC